MGDQLLKPTEAVESEQAGDACVLPVVLLAGWVAAAGDQVWIDRQHAVASIEQRLDLQPMPGIDHHPDLGRVRLQSGKPRDQALHYTRFMRQPELLKDSLARTAERDLMEVLGPVDSYRRIGTSCSRRRGGGRRGAVLMDQSSRDDTLVGFGPPEPTPGDAVSRQSSRDKLGKHSPGVGPRKGG
jgi:hypothetical protein